MISGTDIMSNWENARPAIRIDPSIRPSHGGPFLHAAKPSCWTSNADQSQLTHTRADWISSDISTMARLLTRSAIVNIIIGRGRNTPGWTGLAWSPFSSVSTLALWRTGDTVISRSLEWRLIQNLAPIHYVVMVDFPVIR
jgi:hypothetical protein